MNCQQQLSVRSSAGVLEAPSGYALRCLQDIKAKRTVYLLQNRTFLFATNRPLEKRYPDLKPRYPTGLMSSRARALRKARS